MIFIIRQSALIIKIKSFVIKIKNAARHFSVAGSVCW
jgi:hypothetical protein